jgi:hypothetical protein
VEEQKKLLKSRHEQELLRRRNMKKTSSKSVVKEKDYSMFKMSMDQLKNKLDMNRDICMYSSNWLSDKDYKFYFDKVYYDNIKRIGLDWRTDYRSLLTIHLSSYHNIGTSLLSQ